MKPLSANRAWSVYACVCALALTACGYRTAESVTAGERLCVLAAPSKVPDLAALQAALDGAREELSRYGALASGDDYPCMRIELLRVDELPAGVAAVGIGGREQPVARGTGVAVVGRGWVEAQPGSSIARDTGDVRRTARLQTSTGVLEGTRNDRGLGLAALELGRDLARSVLGLPVASDELP